MVIFVEQIINGKLRENCYLVYDDKNNALIIDPGDEGEKIIGCVETKKLNVLAVLNTHAHYDHIGAINAVKVKFSVPFYLHSSEVNFLKSGKFYSRLLGGNSGREEFFETPEVNFYLDEINFPLRLNDFCIHIIFTPGHSPGSVCFLIENNLFTGDTLFKNAVGRIDLPGGNELELINSLKKLSKLSAEIKIYPGHGKTSTLADELLTNEYFKEACYES